MIGRTLSHYVVLEKLGEGGMGVVYKARDIALDRIVVLKTLHPGQCTNPERKRRFAQEARTASSLNHPNIVTIYEIGTEEGVDFIAMEWVDGSSLDRLIPSNGLPLRLALKYGAQIAGALARAHAAGIIHRDLKPANLLVARDGTVKVADFGLAKLTQGSNSDPHDETASFQQEAPLTEEGAILGTVAFMSPEQAEGKPLDTRSDIFSFGAVLYEMVTGRRAFTGETRISTLAAILTRDPQPVADIVHDVPVELDRVIARCLRKDPERRMQHMGDVGLALSELGEQSDSGRPVAVGGSRKRRWWGAWAAVGAAVVMLAAVASFLLLRRPATAPNWARDATFVQLTSEPSGEIFPSLAPDGNSFVYASRKSGHWHIYLRRVGGRNAIDLTPDSDAENSQPAFSPDGQSIAFRSGRDGGGIFLMGAMGESPHRLTAFGFNPAWSPDGTEIVCADYPVITPEFRSNLRSRLWIVKVPSGEAASIGVDDGVLPAWSPHGRRIAYSGVLKSGARGIWTVDASTGRSVQPVLAARSEPIVWNPVWSPDGAWLYFVSKRAGTMNFWRVRVDEVSGSVSGAQEPVAAPCVYCAHLSFSRDGRRMAYARLSPDITIQTAGFDPVAERLTGPARLLNPALGSGINPHVSPDGKHLAFASTGYHEAIFVSGPLGEDPQQLTSGAGQDRAPHWSPDGKSIVFYSKSSGQWEAWWIAADGSGLRQLTHGSGTGVWYPAWTPDGRRVSYYDSTVGSWVLDVSPSGEPGRPVPLGRLDPARLAWEWSPDGRYLAMVRTSEQVFAEGVGVLDLVSGEFRLLSPTGGSPVWLNDSRRLLFLDVDRLKLLDSADGRVRDLGPAGSVFDLQRIAITPDNRRIYFSTLRIDSDIWMAQLR